MSEQKKTVYRRYKSLNVKNNKSERSVKHYGPPPIPKMVIASAIGSKIKNKNTALRKRRKDVPFADHYNDEVHKYDVMKTGTMSFVKRFKRLDYLESWSSKKSMYNVCEQSAISKMHRRFQSLELQKRYHCD